MSETIELNDQNEFVSSLKNIDQENLQNLSFTLSDEEVQRELVTYENQHVTYHLDQVQASLGAQLKEDFNFSSADKTTIASIQILLEAINKSTAQHGESSHQRSQPQFDVGTINGIYNDKTKIALTHFKKYYNACYGGILGSKDNDSNILEALYNVCSDLVQKEKKSEEKAEESRASSLLNAINKMQYQYLAQCIDDQGNITNMNFFNSKSSDNYIWNTIDAIETAAGTRRKAEVNQRLTLIATLKELESFNDDLSGKSTELTPGKAKDIKTKTTTLQGLRALAYQDNPKSNDVTRLDSYITKREDYLKEYESFYLNELKDSLPVLNQLTEALNPNNYNDGHALDKQQRHFRASDVKQYRNNWTDPVTALQWLKKNPGFIKKIHKRGERDQEVSTLLQNCFPETKLTTKQAQQVCACAYHLGQSPEPDQIMKILYDDRSFQLSNR